MYRTIVIIPSLLLFAVGLAMTPERVAGWYGPMHWTSQTVLVTVDVLLVALSLVVMIYAWRTLGSLPRDLRHLLRHWPRALALGVGVAFALLFLLAGEVTCCLINRANAKGHEDITTGTITSGYFANDPVLGFRPNPGGVYTASKHIGGQPIYDTAYTIDDAGRRVVPGSAGSDADTIVLFFGCSNTFGEGVQNDQTLPAYFAKLKPDAAVYNYGFSGYGPQQMLAAIESGRLDNLVRGKHIVAVFLFIDAHVARTVGSMGVVTNWGIDMPCYELDRNDHVVHQGSFRQARPIRNWLYALLSKSQLVSYFQMDLPRRTDADYHLCARVIEESARTLAARSRSCDFFLVLHPHMRTTNGQLKTHVHSPDVRVLDYVGLYDREDARYFFPRDYHPTPLAYKTIAARLIEDIRTSR